MKKTVKKIMYLMMVLLMMGRAIPLKAMAEEQRTFEVSNFEEFKTAVETINNAASGDYTIKLTADIDFVDSGYDCYFKKNVTILGNGHTIDLGRAQSHGSLIVMENKTLSLGDSQSPNESKLVITASVKDDGLRSDAAIKVGSGKNVNQAGTLHMYDGVEITGLRTNGASPGSAINIVNGIFNMYGGSIHNNVNKSETGIGGAVSSINHSSSAVFNMYGGSIRENKTEAAGELMVAGGGVYLYGGNLTMKGGAIENNVVTGKQNYPSYGGGVYVVYSPSEIVLEGGKISNNSAEHGGGLLVYGSKVNVQKGFMLNGNSAKLGGAIYASSETEFSLGSGVAVIGNSAEIGGGIYNNDGTVDVKSGAVIANNKASSKGDDIAHYKEKMNLALADQMNTKLTTDGSDKLIDGWYIDDVGARWGTGHAELADVSNPIEGREIFLKAAYNAITKHVVTFMSEEGEYAKVKVETGKAIESDSLTEELMPQNPTKSGYTFREWNTQKDGNGEPFTGATVVNEDMTVYAIYSKNVTAINEAPILEVNDKMIKTGESLDLMSLAVSARDKEDGDLTKEIKLVDAGGFDKEKAGKYIITFRVTDKEGASITKKAIVTVTQRATLARGYNKPSKSNKKIGILNKKISPKTGDSSRTSLHVILAGCSGFTLIAAEIGRRRKAR